LAALLASFFSNSAVRLPLRDVNNRIKLFKTVHNTVITVLSGCNQNNNEADNDDYDNDDDDEAYIIDNSVILIN